MPPALRAALSAFAHWLASLDAVHAPRLAALTAPFLHARVHRAVQRRLGRAYASLCARVRDPRSRYEAAATLLGADRPFGSVAALWQIFGIDEEGGEEDDDEDDDEDDEDGEEDDDDDDGGDDDDDDDDDEEEEEEEEEEESGDST
jgi:hypothetical protein